jgi:hypothetical protein
MAGQIFRNAMVRWAQEHATAEPNDVLAEDRDREVTAPAPASRVLMSPSPLRELAVSSRCRGWRRTVLRVFGTCLFSLTTDWTIYPVTGTTIK